MAILKVGDRFASWKDTLGRIEEYGKATHQVFVVAPGQSKTTKKNPLHDLFPYSSARLTCKHGGKYKSHREKEELRERKTTASLKTDCPVEMKVKLIDKMMEVIQMPDESAHNHLQRVRKRETSLLNRSIRRSRQ